MLPFSSEEFFAVFEWYNAAVWPAQYGAYLAGAIVVVLLFSRLVYATRVISAILAVMWLWTGVVYHGIFFSPINPAAYVFSILFVIEALGLGFVTAKSLSIDFRFRPSAASWMGMLLIVYAAILYPLIGFAAGHAYPKAPVFGITPCPVTLFTFGVLLQATQNPPLWILTIPVIWSVIGGSAAILLGVPQDWILLASGFATLLLLAATKRQSSNAEVERRVSTKQV